MIVSTFFMVTACSKFQPFEVDIREDNEGLYILKFKHIRQKEDFDCGEGALAIVLTYWGCPKDPAAILNAIFEDKPAKLGSTAKDLADYAQSLGFEAFLIRTDLDDIREQIRKGRPLIVCRKMFGGFNHYEVVVGYNDTKRHIIIANPAGGVVTCSFKDFTKMHEETDRFTLLVVPRKGSTISE